MALMASGRHLYVQFIDDESGVTLASASTLGGDGKKDLAAARRLGERAASLAAEKGIREWVVDRGGFKFHGRLKAIVNALQGPGQEEVKEDELPEGRSKEES